MDLRPEVAASTDDDDDTPTLPKDVRILRYNGVNGTLHEPPVNTAVNWRTKAENAGKGGGRSK
jgi:hypothetical protein